MRFDEGNSAAYFNIATSSVIRTADGNFETKTDWHNITTSNKYTVDAVEKAIKKGCQVYCDGALETKKYKDKDGIEKSSYSVRLNSPSNFKILRWAPRDRDSYDAESDKRAVFEDGQVYD